MNWAPCSGRRDRAVKKNSLQDEWLESDSAGGFASGTVATCRTRRYHALLLTPLTPPSDRVVLVNGFEAWVDTRSGSFPLSTQHYAPDVVYPRGIDHLADFTHEPWPRWTFQGPGGIEVVHEVIVDRGDGNVLLCWCLTHSASDVRLRVIPLLSGRDYHALMHENTAFAFTARATGGNVTWRPYPELPAITALTNGDYSHEPVWYRNFDYRDEAARGLDHIEDLAAPGTFTFDLTRDEAVLVLRAGDHPDVDARTLATQVREQEAARRKPLTPLNRAAEEFVVRGNRGNTIIAGFPWFTDWGRDTFISMRGLLLSRGRYDVAASILLAWADTVSEGMLPNRFPERGGEPEFNSVDAALWFVIVVHEFLAAARPNASVRARLVGAVTAILDGYTAGTRFGIRMDSDGLLACGVPGMQLTWMDARVGDRVITPRVGKPVEIEALWINALRCAGEHHAEFADRAEAAFTTRFWNSATGGLYDVVDVDHIAGRVDASVRPNQIFAAGGLPYSIVGADVGRAIVATVERELVTPLGPRTLARSDPAYRPRCEGGVAERDGAYHQGTVWPWLIGAFVDAWLNVNGDDDAHRAQARRRFLAPLLDHLCVAGLGHVSEIADGDPPHTPRGCPFQAWSLGELFRALARTAPADAQCNAPSPRRVLRARALTRPRNSSA
ncbi:MAG: glycogen debranching protein [Xanthomonadales bacterium]|nr:glycogen debranching protein [Xanthomonadales bacterium]